MTLYDRDIRAALHAHLAPRKAAGALVVDEMAIYWGDVRADVVSIGPTHLQVWEIKSDHDSLGRLQHQAEMYGHIADEAVLVVGNQLLANAMSHIPLAWGVTRATMDGGVVRLDEVRPPAPLLRQGGYHLAALLWREELVSLLEDHGMVKGHRSKSKPHLCGVVAEALPLNTVRVSVIDRLRRRADWPAMRRPQAAPAALGGSR